MKAGHSPTQVPNRSMAGTPGHILNRESLAQSPDDHTCGYWCKGMPGWGSVGPYLDSGH